MTELLVSVSMRFPADMAPSDLSYVLAPVVRAAVCAGGLTTNLSVESSPAVAGATAVHAGEDPASVATPLAEVTVPPCAPSLSGAQGDRDAIERLAATLNGRH